VGPLRQIDRVNPRGLACDVCRFKKWHEAVEKVTERPIRDRLNWLALKLVGRLEG
jgi:hypothetical protein